MKEEEYIEESTSDFENFEWVESEFPDDDDSSEYATEEFRHLRDLITSDSAKALAAKIKAASLTKELKKSLLSNIQSYYTRDAYLAYIRNVNRVLLNLQYDVELALLSATVHDRRKHEVTQIKSLILDTYPFIASRGVGGLERDLQGKKRVEQRMGHTQDRNDSSEPKRRGWRR